MTPTPASTRIRHRASSASRACTPLATAGDPAANAAATLALAREGDAAGADLLVFPELGLSSYAIDDLLLQDALLDAVEAGIAELVAASAIAARRCCSSARRCAATAGSTTARVVDRARRDPRRRAEDASCPTTANTTRSAGSPPAPA